MNPRILHLGTICRRVVSFTPRPLENTLSTQWLGGCMSPRIGLEGVEKRRSLGNPSAFQSRACNYIGCTGSIVGSFENGMTSLPVYFRITSEKLNYTEICNISYWHIDRQYRT
jgi:hypothetical protein